MKETRKLSIRNMNENEGEKKKKKKRNVLFVVVVVVYPPMIQDIQIHRCFNNYGTETLVFSMRKQRRSCSQDGFIMSGKKKITKITVRFLPLTPPRTLDCDLGGSCHIEFSHYPVYATRGSSLQTERNGSALGHPFLTLRHEDAILI